MLLRAGKRDIVCVAGKIFTASLGTSQWAQIEKSVKTAIDSHPNLEKYYIALPLDMPDGKVEGQSSMMDKWKTKVVEWQNYALSKCITITFEYWGSAELISRLSKKENEGLLYFWFNKEEFSDDWLSIKNRESINALGPRYTRELNFELPIAKVFNGISRDNHFQEQVHKAYEAFLEKYQRMRITTKHIEINRQLDLLKTTVQEVKGVFESFSFLGIEPLPFKDLKEKLTKTSDITAQIEDNLYQLQDSIEKEKDNIDYYSRPHANDISDVSSFESSIHDFSRFLNSPVCILANKPYLLITGDAGMGKSHLLADIVEKRKERNQKSLLLLGENFTSSEMPWTQMLQNQLRKPQIDEFVFLGALNAIAESERTRLVVFIDAINEGNGRKVWLRKLKSFIQAFEPYPWLGLVISIRTSFEDLIAPQSEIDKDLMIRVKHEGFAGAGYAVVKRFFMHYKIIQPSSPLLNPEFQNPLFLKLFCKSLSDRGLHEVPSGYEGITSIIDYFLDSVHLKLAQPDELDYDEKIYLIKTVVQKLVLEMVTTDQDHVTYQKANEIVNSVFQGHCGRIEPYLKRLISEGVLNQDIYWDENGKDFDVIYLPYQRFQDHLTVSLLLDIYLDADNPESSFRNGKLYDIIKDSLKAHANQNLVEALSIQLPERINRELFQLAPDAKLYPPVIRGFIKSLIWRKNETIGEHSRSYVYDVIIHKENLFREFLEVTVAASMKRGFYFNAERLHAFLMGFSLPERDEMWTIWLQDKYENEETYSSAVKRIVDFAWDTEAEHNLFPDETIALGCITLGWFLSSANRYLRDATTKALVCLLQNRIHLISGLLEKFKGVNDPYILERLYAAAYGAVLRTNQLDQLVPLSDYIYSSVFNKGKVYPHILLRDYARNIIEYTLHLKLKPKVNISKVRPPYSSKNIPKRLPSVKTIDKKYEPQGDSGNYGRANWGATAILMSMTTEYGRRNRGYGDFGRYVFQRAFDDWDVDADGLSNYAVQRIFELGYDPKKFSAFDARQGSGRSSGHKERIGKKYQWIVFYELLARVSDHYQLIDESNFDTPKKILPFEGPWYPYVRDIDPTILIKETLAEKYVDAHTHYWWYNQSYAPWLIDHKKWITDREDLPAPENIIEVSDENGDKWLWLEIHPEWSEKEVLGETDFGPQRKLLWYQVRSYFVKQEELPKLEQAFNCDFHRRELPESRRLHTVFDKEYYWSPAFNFFNKPYYSGEDWINVHDKKTRKFITKVHRTTEEFNWEEEFDCSKESAIQYYKPVQLIQRSLNLKVAYKEGELLDIANRLACFDPSVHHKSISGLLIRKNEMVSFLEKEKLALVWSVVGEKQFLGNHRVRKGYPGRLNISGLYSLENGIIKGN